MNTIKFFMSSLILAFLYAGCQSNDFPVTQTKISATSPTPPILSSSPQPTITLHTPEATEQLPLKRQCLAESNLLLKQDSPTGRLVLAYPNGSGNYFLLDLKNMEQRDFIQKNGSMSDLAVSPNHRLMLYFNENTWQNEITGLEGKTQIIPYSSDEWASIAWLDDERVVLGRTGEVPDNTIQVYNYLTAETSKLSLDIPSPYYWSHPLSGKKVLIASVNPDLTRIVFFDMQDRGRIIFWDSIGEKVLAFLPYPVSLDPWDVPSVPFFSGWSSDGKQFTTTSPLEFSEATGEITVEELFRFDYDGQITQLTHLSDYYRFVRISEPIKSPDGETVAFWLEVSENANRTIDTLTQQLVILNNKTGEITDLCLPFGDPSYSSAASQPIWSPDGNYLIVYTRPSGDKRMINLVNIEENSFIVLQEDYIPVGWMIDP